MKKVLIYANEGRDPEFRAAADYCRFLRDRGAEVCVPADKPLEGAVSVADPSAHVFDFALVLGGDGTVIRAALYLEGTQTPLVAVNLGHLGFMTEISRENAEEKLKDVLEGKYRVEKRMMLNAVLRWSDGTEESLSAINDFVLRRSDYSGAIAFSADINGAPLATFKGDGVIVATPNGSTGYNLSAGGPIISPVAENIILTPLCNHSILERSLVLAGSDRVTLHVAPTEYQDAPLFSGDSFLHRRIEKPCDIELTKSKHRFSLIRLGEESFFRVLEEKMRG